MDKAADAFRTISEVAEDLDLPQHVLRFWETKFTHIRPLKRGGGRRYYRPEDVDLVRGIRYLLYGQGYTIKGVQRIIKEQGAKAVMSLWKSADETAENVRHDLSENRDRSPSTGDADQSEPDAHILDDTAQVSEELIAAVETYDLGEEPLPEVKSLQEVKNLPYQQRSDVSIMRGGLGPRPASGAAISNESRASRPSELRQGELRQSNPGSVVLSAQERGALMGVLQDLAECRRILDAAGRS